MVQTGFLLLVGRVRQHGYARLRLQHLLHRHLHVLLDGKRRPGDGRHHGRLPRRRDGLSWRVRGKASPWGPMCGCINDVPEVSGADCSQPGDGDNFNACTNNDLKTRFNEVYPGDASVARGRFI